MHDTARYIQSIVALSGANQAPAAREVLDRDVPSPGLGDGYAMQYRVAQEYVSVAPGVTCRFNQEGGIRLITDPVVVDGDRVRNVVQNRMNDGAEIRFIPAFNAHSVRYEELPNLIEALKRDGEAVGGAACARLAAVIERGPRQS